MYVKCLRVISNVHQKAIDLLRLLIFIFFPLIIICISCHPSESVDVKIYNTGVNYELTALHWWNRDTGIVVGGVTWTGAAMIKTNNGGLQWESSDLYGREIFGLGVDQSNTLYGCGIDKKIYRFNTESNKVHTFGDFIYFRSIDAFDLNHIFIVGGESFGTGYIYHASIKDSFLQIVLDTKRELNTIHCFDSSNWITAGFGIILRTNDGGLKWDTLAASSDHFLDMSFINEKTGYVCGIGGSILKTTDAGKSWKFVRNASSIFVSGQPFHCICFRDEWNGLVAGENGIVWRTEDGGKKWIEIEDAPIVSYLDIQWDGTQYWLCGSNGTLISFIPM